MVSLMFNLTLFTHLKVFKTVGSIITGQLYANGIAERHVGLYTRELCQLSHFVVVRQNIKVSCPLSEDYRCVK